MKLPCFRSGIAEPALQALGTETCQTASCEGEVMQDGTCGATIETLVRRGHGFNHVEAVALSGRLLSDVVSCVSYPLYFVVWC